MFNHNTHFHDYLLRQIPNSIYRSLDVGCGEGLFAFKLAKRSKIVDAIEVDSTIINQAHRHHSALNIRYLNTDFLIVDLPQNSYDVIVSIASIHHMNLESALEKMKRLLHPSGKLLILGLYQEMTVVDYLYSMISIPLNQIYLNWYGTSMTMPTNLVPTLPAQLSIQQIKEVAHKVIPDFSLQRHLFWRYSLIWQKPLYN